MDIEDVIRANDAIQEWISEHGKELPEELLKLLADLDWSVHGP
jgi:hypothetical protein